MKTTDLSTNRDFLMIVLLLLVKIVVESMEYH
jgi:hypothetical protein